MQSRISLVLFVIFLCGCAASTSRPVTAESVSKEFLTAYNSGSVAALSSFFERYAAEGRRQNAPERAQWVHSLVWLPIRQLEVVSTQNLTSHEVSMLGRSILTEAWYRFSIELDPETGGVA